MFNTIVVGTDGSETAGSAVERAVALAALTGATLHVVNAYRAVSAATMGAVEGVPIDVGNANTAAAEESSRVCERAAAPAVAQGLKVATHPVAGDAPAALIHVANEVGADLIVIGNRGMSGKKRFVLGSVPNTVSHHSPCNLLIVDTTTS